MHPSNESQNCTVTVFCPLMSDRATLPLAVAPPTSKLHVVTGTCAPFRVAVTEALAVLLNPLTLNHAVALAVRTVSPDSWRSIAYCAGGGHGGSMVVQPAPCAWRTPPFVNGAAARRVTSTRIVLRILPGA